MLCSEMCYNCHHYGWHPHCQPWVGSWVPVTLNYTDWNPLFWRTALLTVCPLLVSLREIKSLFFPNSVLWWQCAHVFCLVVVYCISFFNEKNSNHTLKEKKKDLNDFAWTVDNNYRWEPKHLIPATNVFNYELQHHYNGPTSSITRNSWITVPVSIT